MKYHRKCIKISQAGSWITSNPLDPSLILGTPKDSSKLNEKHKAEGQKIQRNFPKTQENPLKTAKHR